MHRRTYLLGATTAAVGLAGCNGLSGSDDEADDEEDDDQTEETDDPSTNQPTAAFALDYFSEGELTITFDSGDTIKAANLFVRGDFDADTSGGNWSALGGDASSEVGGDPAVSAGDGVTVEAGPAYDVQVVWEAGDDSATLSTAEGPEA